MRLKITHSIGLLIVMACPLVLQAVEDDAKAVKKSANDELPLVAIDEFKNEANAPDQLFGTLRSRITGDIANTRKFTVVERSRLKSILSERKLVESGHADEKDAPEAGKIKTANFVMYGSVLSLGLDARAAEVGDTAAAKLTAKVEIQLRFSDAETSAIVATKTILATKSQARVQGSGEAAAGNMPDQVLQDAIREASKKVTEALMDLAYPAKIIAVGDEDVKVNLTKEQTELDAVYEVFAPGEKLVDPDTGKSLGVDEKLVGEIVITRTQPKFAVAQPRSKVKIVAFKVGMIVRRLDPEIAKKRAAQEKEAQKDAVKSRF